MLGPEVVVRSCELVDPQFDARHSAHVAALPLHDPQPAGARSVPRPVRVVGARAARSARAAARRPIRSSASTTSRRSAARARRARRLTRRVLESRWVDEGDGVLRYEIRANAFCWQMVRSIVGTLVEVGAGQAPARATCMAILRAARPRRGGPARPAARPVPLGSRLLSAGVSRRHASGSVTPVGVAGGSEVGGRSRRLELRHDGSCSPRRRRR